MLTSILAISHTWYSHRDDDDDDAAAVYAQFFWWVSYSLAAWFALRDHFKMCVVVWKPQSKLKDQFPVKR